MFGKRNSELIRKSFEANFDPSPDLTKLDPNHIPFGPPRYLLLPRSTLRNLPVFTERFLSPVLTRILIKSRLQILQKEGVNCRQRFRKSAYKLQKHILNIRKRVLRRLLPSVKERETTPFSFPTPRLFRIQIPGLLLLFLKQPL